MPNKKRDMSDTYFFPPTSNGFFLHTGITCFISLQYMHSTKIPTLWLTTLGWDAPPLVSRPWSPLTRPTQRRDHANYLVYILTGTICACWLGEHADDSPGETTHAHPHTRYKCTHWLGHQLATNKCPAGGYREAEVSDQVTPWPCLGQAR